MRFMLSVAMVSLAPTSIGAQADAQSPLPPPSGHLRIGRTVAECDRPTEVRGLLGVAPGLPVEERKQV